LCDYEIRRSSATLPHVNPFRSILALLMAVLVIWPACCCMGATFEQDTRSSCCSAAEQGAPGERESRENPHQCDCLTKEPREAVKTSEPPAQTPAMPAVDDWASPATAVSRQLAVALPRWTGGCDPPRLILARYSRWLI